MIQAVIASLPLNSRFVPGCLENVIDKKVAGLALNILERFADWLCTWIYCPYSALYVAKKERICVFEDAETRLIDSTRKGNAKVEFEWEKIDGLGQTPKKSGPSKNDRGYLSLEGKRIIFFDGSSVINKQFVGSDIDYLVIKDDPKRPGCYTIIEQKKIVEGSARRMEVFWSIDTNQPATLEDGTSVFLAQCPD